MSMRASAEAALAPHGAQVRYQKHQGTFTEAGIEQMDRRLDAAEPQMIEFLRRFLQQDQPGWVGSVSPEHLESTITDVMRTMRNLFHEGWWPVQLSDDVWVIVEASSDDVYMLMDGQDEVERTYWAALTIIKMIREHQITVQPIN